MEQVMERRSNLVMPTNCVELDRDEMTYVEGGARTLIGTYASTNTAGSDWLLNIFNQHMATMGLYVTDLVLYAIAAGGTCITAVGPAIFGVISGVCGIIAGKALSLADSAYNAYEEALAAQRNGKTYSVYENTFLGVTTGYSVEY